MSKKVRIVLIRILFFILLVVGLLLLFSNQIQAYLMRSSSQEMVITNFTAEDVKRNKEKSKPTFDFEAVEPISTEAVLKAELKKAELKREMRAQASELDADVENNQDDTAGTTTNSSTNHSGNQKNNSTNNSNNDDEKNQSGSRRAGNTNNGGNAAGNDDNRNDNNFYSSPAYPVVAGIAIPSVNINLPIFLGVANEYLLWGAGTLSADQVMGQGNYALASHLSYDPNALFSPLVNVSTGDKIYTNDLENIYVYEAYAKEWVAPDAMYVLDDVSGQAIITLVTCGEFDASNRLIVHGTLTDVIPVDQAPSEILNAFTF